MGAAGWRYELGETRSPTDEPTPASRGKPMIYHERLRPPSCDYPSDEWNVIEKGFKLNPRPVGTDAGAGTDIWHAADVGGRWTGR